ncbi:hypothetical protein [Novosphingobium mathurense]|nr:hypothetical protein [Novosphingobium mathurense]
MAFMRHLKVDRICMMFVLSLALLFASAMAWSNMVVEMQHAPGQADEHESVLLSSLTAQLDHLDDHFPDQEDEDEAGGALQGHHHHSGDTNSAIPTDASHAHRMATVDANLHAIGPDCAKPGSELTGLERPPRLLAMNA